MRRPGAVHRAIQGVRAATVLRPAPAVFLSEIGSARTASYRFRGDQREVVLRHGTRDVEILNEIFSHHGYAHPPEVDRLLAGRSISVLDLGGNVGLSGSTRLAPGRCPRSIPMNLTRRTCVC